MRIAMTWLLRATVLIALSTPLAATAQTAPLPRPARQAPAGPGPAIMPVTSLATCDAGAMDSPPAKIWWAQERWRYADDASATAAYQTLVNKGLGGSPWPAWYLPTPTAPATPGILAQPPVTILPVGTRFQMALSPGQTEAMPGGWGTFDYIADVQDVREFLAVTHAFKKQLDRVVTYEVTRMLPVLIGPVGPQVDTETCEYFPGRWSQFNMLPWKDRMDYLRVIEVRPIPEAAVIP